MRFLAWIACAAAGIVIAAVSTAAAEPAATAWITGHNSKVRLLADGSVAARDGDVFYAGIEIQLQPGWKTYWRMPGDAGVPPNFDWSTSENVASVAVLYPAPLRMPDQGGEAIGYKGAVMFPVRIQPKDRALPVRLNVALEYGVCRDICIPTEARLELVLAPGRPATEPDPAIAAALRKVPRALANRLATDPAVLAISGGLASAAPQIRIEVREAIDVFIEAPDGLFLPQPVRVDGKGQNGAAVYLVDLTKAPDAKDMLGKPLRITAIGTAGAIETTWILK